MPQHRVFTDKQEARVLAEFRAGGNRRGVIAGLARKYFLSWQGMRDVLDRAEARETSSQCSTGNLETDGGASAAAQ